MSDPDLKTRLSQAREEMLFKEHLQQIFGQRHTEFSSTLRDSLRELWKLAKSSADGTRAHRQQKKFKEALEEQDQTKQRVMQRPTLYPAKTGKWTPEVPAASDRDRTKPPCSSCGGRGMGDYPYPCDTCGGSGNA